MTTALGQHAGRKIIGVRLVDGRAVGWLYERGNNDPAVEAQVAKLMRLAWSATIERSLALTSLPGMDNLPSTLDRHDSDVNWYARSCGFYLFIWPKPFTTDADGSYRRRFQAASARWQEVQRMVFR